jgi:citrate synthase
MDKLNELLAQVQLQSRVLRDGTDDRLVVGFGHRCRPNRDQMIQLRKALQQQLGEKANRVAIVAGDVHSCPLCVANGDKYGG